MELKLFTLPKKAILLLRGDDKEITCCKLQILFDVGGVQDYLLRNELHACAVRYTLRLSRRRAGRGY